MEAQQKSNLSRKGTWDAINAGFVLKSYSMDDCKSALIEIRNATC